MVDDEKWLIATDLNFQKIVRTLQLKEDKWPLVQRNFSLCPETVFGVSIPDLIEDKQRAEVS